MRRFWALLAAAVLTAGCERNASTTPRGGASMVLTIDWQRLVTKEGGTCDRCGGTQEELGKAVETLRESLRPLGIEVGYTERALTIEECAEDIVQSNRILVGDRTLEEWLCGEVGQSPCGSCCSAIGQEVECRTVCVDGSTYDVIPAELIVRAGLLAASHMLGAPTPDSCCPGTTGSCKAGA